MKFDHECFLIAFSREYVFLKEKPLLYNFQAKRGPFND